MILIEHNIPIILDQQLEMKIQFNLTNKNPMINIIYNMENIFTFYLPYTIQSIFEDMNMNISIYSESNIPIQLLTWSYHSNISYNNIIQSSINSPISLSYTKFNQHEIKSYKDLEKWECYDYYNKSTISYNNTIRSNGRV